MFPATPVKDMTWKDVLLSILGGYASVVLFFILARFFTPNFLFNNISNQGFSEGLYYMMAAIFLLAYSIYVVNKIIWFSLWKNGYCSVVYGRIRRFFVTYVWCYCFGIIPFHFLAVFLSGVFVESIIDMTSFLWSLFITSVSFSFFLIPLILIQRFIIVFYRIVVKKPIGSLEDNAQFWQFRNVTSSVIFSPIILRYFVSMIGEFCYWFAVVVFVLTTCIFVTFVWYFTENTVPMSDTYQGDGTSRMLVYYAMFGISFRILRSLIPVRRHCLKQLFSIRS